MTTRRRALTLLASVPVIAGTRPAWAAPTPEPTPPSVRTIPLRGNGTVRTVRADAPFSLVGLKWDGPAPEAAELRVRRGGAWSEWIPVSPADGGAAAASEAVWTGRARVVQVRALRAGTAAPGLSVVLVDPGHNPLDKLLEVLPLPSDGGLEVVRRSQWGAGSGRCGPPEYAPPVRAVAVHHTAGSNGYGPDESAGVVRGIWVYHAQTLGWCDIGYHALVDRFGRIFEGRAGGLDRAVIGAHAGGFNLHTSSVSMMGTFGAARPPRAMQRALVRFLDWKLDQHGLDPHGKTVLVSQGGGTSRYAPGTEVRVPVIFGHRDVGTTACPGDHGYDLLPALRDRTSSASSLLPDLPDPL